MVKVLVSDTKPSVLRALKTVLSRYNYGVFTASDTAKLSFLIKNNDFDLVVLDLTIEGLNAFETIQMIHRSGQNTAIISVCDTASYDIAVETVKQGAYDLLMKPYDSKFILPLIRRAIFNSLEFEQSVAEDEFSYTGDVFQFMIERSRDIQFLLDINGNIVFINKRVESMLGFKRSDLVGKHYTKIIYRDDLVKLGFRFHDKRRHYFSSRSIEVRLNCVNKKSDMHYFDITSVSLPEALNVPSSLIPADNQNNNEYGQAVTFCIAHDISSRKKVEGTLKRKASYDYLTGLPNKMLFSDRLNLAVAQAKRDSSVFAVMYLDLDGFKLINDLYGHNIGDKTLMAISTRLRSCLREGDTLARIGGDEFTLLLPRVTNKTEAEAIANKITVAVNKPFIIDGKNHQLSVSVGIALYPQDGQSVKHLIEGADHAMYQIKHGNKNGYQFVQHR